MILERQIYRLYQYGTNSDSLLSRVVSNLVSKKLFSILTGDNNIGTDIIYLSKSHYKELIYINSFFKDDGINNLLNGSIDQKKQFIISCFDFLKKLNFKKLDIEYKSIINRCEELINSINSGQPLNASEFILLFNQIKSIIELINEVNNRTNDLLEYKYNQIVSVKNQTMSKSLKGSDIGSQFKSLISKSEFYNDFDKLVKVHGGILERVKSDIDVKINNIQIELKGGFYDTAYKLLMDLISNVSYSNGMLDKLRIISEMINHIIQTSNNSLIDNIIVNLNSFKQSLHILVEREYGFLIKKFIVGKDFDKYDNLRNNIIAFLVINRMIENGVESNRLYNYIKKVNGIDPIGETELKVRGYFSDEFISKYIHDNINEYFVLSLADGQQLEKEISLIDGFNIKDLESIQKVDMPLIKLQSFGFLYIKLFTYKLLIPVVILFQLIYWFESLLKKLFTSFFLVFGK